MMRFGRPAAIRARRSGRCWCSLPRARRRGRWSTAGFAWLPARPPAAAAAPVTVETLGEAWRAGWRVKARCAHGRRDGMMSFCEDHREYELEIETLAWTRGAGLPLSDLAGRLRCPTCRSLQVTVAFVPPPIQDENRSAAPAAAQDELTGLPHRVELRRGDGAAWRSSSPRPRMLSSHGGRTREP